ncbi:MAG: choice-of-anchor D domain-containing protein [Candidatus Riflebacteria bacterium]|nr:choice-of-anchor D domain-containing protein [Candidatus Riflebacteria bacterium]
MKARLLIVVLFLLLPFYFSSGGCGRIGNTPGSAISNEVRGAYIVAGVIEFDQSIFNENYENTPEPSQMSPIVLAGWLVKLSGENNFIRTAISSVDGKFSFSDIPVLNSPQIEAVSPDEKIRLTSYFEDGKITSSQNSVYINESSTIISLLWQMNLKEGKNIPLDSILSLKRTNNPVFLNSVSALKELITAGEKNFDKMDSEIMAALAETSKFEKREGGLLIIPNPLDFGTASMNVNIATSCLTLKNQSEEDILISTYTISGPFIVDGKDFPFILKPGELKIMSLTFYPIEDGINKGMLSIDYNRNTGRQNIQLFGNSVQEISKVFFEPDLLDFGEQFCGASSTPKLLKVINSGNETKTFGLKHSNDDFIVSDGQTSFSLLPYAETVYKIVFNPKNVGTLTSELKLICSETGETYSVQMKGFGVPFQPKCVLSPESLDFAYTETGTLSNWKEIDISNTGERMFAIKSIDIDGPFEISDIEIPSYFQPGVKKTMKCRFKSQTEGVATGQLKLYYDVTDEKKVVSLSGVGVTVKPELTIFPEVLDFGTVKVGETSSSKYAVLHNTGKRTLNVSTIASSGDYLVQGAFSPLVLEPGQKKNLEVKFRPLSGGYQEGNIWYFSDELPSSKKVSFIGTGTIIAPVASVTPVSIDFGTIEIGSESSNLSIVLSNTGNADLKVSEVVIEGQFDFSDISGSFILSPFGEKSFSCRFKPADEGIKGGNLIFRHNASPSETIVSLRGTGKLSEVTMDAEPSEINFGEVTVFASSSSHAVTLTNTGKDNLVIYSLETRVPFSISKPAFPVILGSNESFTFNCSYSPVKSGNDTETLDIHSNSWPTPRLITVTGTGK